MEQDSKGSPCRIPINTECPKTLKIPKGKYATLKKLFLDKYKDKYNALNATDMVEIDRLVKEYEEAEKAAGKTKAA